MEKQNIFKLNNDEFTKYQNLYRVHAEHKRKSVALKILIKGKNGN